VEELAGLEELGDDESQGAERLGVAAFLRRLLWTLRVGGAFQTSRGSFADRTLSSQHTAVIRLTKTKHTAPSRKTHSWILAPADHRLLDIL
jgi:hypothetical protein